MPIDPNIALQVRPLEVPNPMNQLAQVSQIQAAQRQGDVAQMKLEDMIAERKELNQFAAKIKEKGFEPRAYMEMLITSRNPEMQKMGIEGIMRINRQDKFEKTYSKILPQLFGMAPEGAAAPAAVPTAPMQPGALGSGTFDVVPEPTRTNALAPAAASTTPAAPVNQLAAPQAAGMSIPQMEMLALQLANEDDPRAKTAVSLIEKKIEAARKPSLHVVPGVGLVDVTGKTVRASEVAPSEFERLLSGAGLTDAQKTELRRQRALKEATHAPPVSVSMTQEKAEAGAFGKFLVEDQFKPISQAAALATKTLPGIEANLSALNKGLDTGFGTDAKAAGARILGALGVQNAEKFATDTQTFQSNAISAVLQKQLEQKGPQTESDAKRIEQVGAQLGKTKDANKFILDVAREQLKRDIDQRNFYANWQEKTGSFKGAENAWFAGEGGKSLFDRPALKQYGVSGPAAATSAVNQIPTNQTPTQAPAVRTVVRTGTLNGRRVVQYSDGSTAYAD